ncbi:MAG: Ig-like domain-containing protein [Lysobacteraceae bacterium]
MRLSDLRASLTLALLLLPLSASADVFINEIHYDNASTDEGEAIEVVATAGEDLSQYSIHYYTSASASTSGSVPASSPISCGSGNPAFGVINYPVNGLQNNGPKAMALVVGGSVIQFLSYEGALTATAGVANGLTSTDIGVAEDGGTAVGESLQLSGNGSTYADFTWNSAATNTFGACNNGQTFGAPVDNPPTVNATAPAEGDTDIPVNSTLSVTFSEPVTASPGAFSLSCVSGGVISLNADSGPTTYTLTPMSSLDFNDSCTLTITGANIADQDGTPENMISNVTVDFQTAIDTAPSVISTTPADSDIDVNYFSNITVVFSEPVNVVDPDWLTLDCGSGAITGTTSGNDASHVFNPDSDLPAGAHCTATVVATKVTDKDGLADEMTGNVVVEFDVAADLAPTLSSSYPGNNDVNIAVDVNITVTFSEPVTVGGSAIDISCTSSGAHTFGISTVNDITFTLNPDADFDVDEDCSVSLTGTLITDQDGSPDPMGADDSFTFTTSAGAGDYYASVDASSCTTLRTTLHNLIKDHTAYPYSAGTTDTWDILKLADEDPLDSGRILDIYKNASYLKADGGNSNYNREHTWPNSHGFNDITFLDGYPNAPYNDTHMLYLSDINYNTERGNNPYDNCNPALDGSCDPFVTDAYAGQGGGPTTYPGEHNWSNGSSSFEVWSKRKGDAARAILYMDVRYEGGTNSLNGQREPDLIVTDNRSDITISPSGTFVSTGYMGLKSTLLAWHASDPPDSAEVLRNTLVQTYQGNRNPFIDHPEWAECLFNCVCPNALTANDDSYNVNEDSGLNTFAAPGVLGNDNHSDPITSVSLTSDVSHGTLSLHTSNGSFDYTPDSNFCGTDSFVYEASDGSLSDTATVTLTVNCLDDGPAPAQNDSLTTDEDTPGTAPVTSNDGTDPDPEQNPLTVTSVTDPANGSAGIVSGGTEVEYTPDPNYCGGDSFSYSLTGGGSATVSVTVTCLNDAPVANADSYGVNEDSALTVLVAQGVLANDTDAEADDLLATITANVQHGNLNFNADGSFTYTPDADFCGADSFSYRASDGLADSNVATATITVACINDAPVAAADSYNGTRNTQLQVTAPGVLANDNDVDGDDLSAVLVSNPISGSLILNGDGSFSYTPNLDYCGSDSFQYKATDGGADSATVQVTLNIDCLNQAPVAAANSYFGSEDAPFSVAAVVGVLANDSDANGDELTAVLDDDVQHGSLTLNADGSFDYAPDANYCGSDSFTYHANDGAADSNVATVTITVQCANDAPVSLGDSYAGTQDTLLSVVAPGVLDNDSDVENDTLEAILDVDAQHGVLSLNADGSFSYTPDGGFCGSDSFSYHANDGSDDSATANVTLTIACTSDAIFADGFE